VNITHIETLADGTVIATVADDAGNVVGTNTYSPESYPRPSVGSVEEPGILRRIWTWITGPDDGAPTVEA
jgi:hypothetical protein